MPRLEIGERAPQFALKDQAGRTVRLADYKGKKLLVYFYPRADTPGCTRQACSIRDSAAALAGRRLAAVGISPDDPAGQSKFDRKFGLGFPLLSDPDHAVAEAYGAWGEKSMYGRKSMGVIRSSFVVDEDGKIAGAWYKVSPEDTVPKALAAVE